MNRPVIYLDDLFRPTFGMKQRNYFDHFQAIFERAFGLSVQSPRWEPEKSTYFSLNDLYKEIDFSPEETSYWVDIWFRGDELVKKFLGERLPKGVIVLLHEVAPWMTDFFTEKSIMFIEAKTSNIRFTHDVPIMISTNIPDLARIIHDKYLYGDLDIRFEARMLRALIRNRFNFKGTNTKFGPYKHKLVYIGQNHDDSSIIIDKKGRRGSFAQLEEFLEPILLLMKDYKGLIYQKHPSANINHVRKQAQLLNSLARKDFMLGNELLYHVYALAEDIRAIGLSSGGLIEAPFFGQPSTLLLENPFESYYSDEKGVARYLNLRAKHFLSPGFWQEALGDILEPLVPFTETGLFGTDSFRIRHNINYNYSKIISQNSELQRDILRIFNLESLPARLTELEKKGVDPRKSFFGEVKQKFINNLKRLRNKGSN